MLCTPLIGLFFKLRAAVAHHIPHDHGNGFIELLIGSLLRRHAEEVESLAVISLFACSLESVYFICFLQKILSIKILNHLLYLFYMNIPIISL